MINLKNFNEKYTDQKAKELRDQIADLTFNIQYFQIRAQALTEELNMKHIEYMTLLGVPQNGENEKK